MLIDSNVPSLSYKEAFRGFFDTDASISIKLVNRKAIKSQKKFKTKKEATLNIPVGFELAFAFSQYSKEEYLKKLEWIMTKRVKTRKE